LIQIKTDLLFCNLFRWSLTGSEKEHPGTRIAVFANHSGAENTVKKLNLGGFAVKPLTAVGKFSHTEENLAGFCNTGDRVKFWVVSGACFRRFAAVVRPDGEVRKRTLPPRTTTHAPRCFGPKRVSFTKRKIV
jgi:hypothetical protein